MIGDVVLGGGERVVPVAFVLATATEDVTSRPVRAGQDNWFR